jgi:geranylgeranyl reductase family protein
MKSLSTDVLVIGAGPAGSAAARAAAQKGCRVVLVDRHAFPRDKVCGDALIPDALHALETLGLKQRVLAHARLLQSVHIYAPDGESVALRGSMASLPRQQLDALLFDAAREAGASALEPCELRAAIDEDGAIGGAIFAPRSGAEDIRVTAALTILATGAAVGPLRIFGVCERTSPSAIAARVYVQAPSTLAQELDHLCISYDRAILPGYGWVFPLPNGVFNVGVGGFTDGRAIPADLNLRHLIARFGATFPPARALLGHGKPLTDVRGAPLRTALAGARLDKPGLLVVGEAAGLTYSFSGEGIGKSLASGLIAGALAARATADRLSKEDVARLYITRIQSDFAALFNAYKIAQNWLAHPWFVNLLAKRANAGRYARRQLEGLLAETVDPRALFSPYGLIRALVG